MMIPNGRRYSKNPDRLVEEFSCKILFMVYNYFKEGAMICQDILNGLG